MALGLPTARRMAARDSTSRRTKTLKRTVGNLAVTGIAIVSATVQPARLSSCGRRAAGQRERGLPREQQAGTHTPGHEPQLSTPEPAVDSAAGGSEMRVLIATAGGRGDVAPFTGLGAAMR